MVHGKLHEQLAVGFGLGELVPNLLVLDEPAAVGRLLSVGLPNDLLEGVDDLPAVLGRDDAVNHLHEAALGGELQLGHLSLGQVEIEFFRALHAVVVVIGDFLHNHCDFPLSINKN